jgi:hypothetical protein
LQPQNIECHEAYFSAIQQETEEQAWIQGADVYPKRTQYPERKKKEGPQEAVCFR